VSNSSTVSSTAQHSRSIDALAAVFICALRTTCEAGRDGCVEQWWLVARHRGCSRWLTV